MSRPGFEPNTYRLSPNQPATCGPFHFNAYVGDKDLIKVQHELVLMHILGFCQI